MLGTWGGGAGIVGLHVDLHVGGWKGLSCWALGREAVLMDLHVGHLGRRLGWWVFMLDTWEGGWNIEGHVVEGFSLCVKASLCKGFFV